MLQVVVAFLDAGSLRALFWASGSSCIRSESRSKGPARHLPDLPKRLGGGLGPRRLPAANLAKRSRAWTHADCFGVSQTAQSRPQGRRGLRALTRTLGFAEESRRARPRTWWQPPCTRYSHGTHRGERRRAGRDNHAGPPRRAVGRHLSVAKTAAMSGPTPPWP
jgi:hypothetical protein